MYNFNNLWIRDERLIRLFQWNWLAESSYSPFLSFFTRRRRTSDIPAVNRVTPIQGHSTCSVYQAETSVTTTNSECNILEIAGCHYSRARVDSLRLESLFPCAQSFYAANRVWGSPHLVTALSATTRAQTVKIWELKHSQRGRFLS